jgi:Cu(I)/Ag(I) efflux system membrane protein CusA/SilA
MRYGDNAQQVITRIKTKLSQLKKSLPKGVEVIPVYDRSALINDAVSNLTDKLIEEFTLVALVCVVFLFHLRSALVVIISLPVGILAAYIIMHVQGLNANIMSLGGIAIAISAMVDGAIVMIENMHKHLENAPKKTPLTDKERWRLVTAAACEVGPALFFSLLIITVSFIPIFTLEAQEGRMFSPLAFTKTYAMAAAAALSITLVPVLMGYFIRGKPVAEQKNPLNKVLTLAYLPMLKTVLSYPKTTLCAAIILLMAGLYPLNNIGSEFMPPLDEGDLMYMPTTYPGISIGQARQLLQQTDKLIKTVPEVLTVFGKVGRAETATDPAPLTMIETFIQLKPRSQWRAGTNLASLKKELDNLVKLPGVTNAWVMPIKTRIDMLATGIKTPLGIKIFGPNLAGIQAIGQQLETVLRDIPGTASVYAERVIGGRYIKVDIKRLKAARYGLNISDIQQVVATAIGGINITNTVEGLERYPVNIRYPQDYRNSPEQLALLPVVTAMGQRIALGDVADIFIEDGPAGIKSENARLTGLVFIDLDDSSGINISDYVKQAQQQVDKTLTLPVGYSIDWAGQYEYMQRAKAKLRYVIPLTLTIIIILLYINFKNMLTVALILGTLPLAMVGSLWLMYLLGYSFSVAVSVGFIALAGVAVEIGVIMLVYLNKAYAELTQHHTEQAISMTKADVFQAVMQGAGLRIRPIMMTGGTVIIGLLPILFGTGTGSEVMSRIAAPMIGGMVSAMFLTLLILPTLYYLWRSRGLSNS